MTTSDLQILVSSMIDDETKFNTGNNSAGSRLRKTLQSIKKAAQDMRIEVLEKQKEAKSK